MNWDVELVGDEFDLEELARTFRNDEASVIEKDNTYVLQSSSFSKYTDVKDVERAAVNTLVTINGILKLFLDARNPIEISAISFINAGGNKHSYVSIADHIHTRDKVGAIVDKGGIAEEIRPLDSAQEYLSVAKDDDIVLNVLRHISTRNSDWVTLYRIFEMIEENAGGFSVLIENGWLSRSMAKRFKRTANSPTVIGEDARHGKESTEPPPNPMNIFEARSFIKSLVHAWITSKVN